MRTNILLSLFLFFSLFSVAQSKLTIDSMEKISKGMIEQGMSDLQLAMKANDIVAQFFWGQCYEYGRYVEKNEVQAFLMYRKAAERGLVDGMHKLAECYDKGIGVAKDSEKASVWMERFKYKGGKLLLPDFIKIYDNAILLSATLP